MSRDQLMAKAKKLQARAIAFDERARNPKYFRPSMLCERDYAKQALESTINELMRRYPGEWSIAEQELLRPL